MNNDFSDKLSVIFLCTEKDFYKLKNNLSIIKQMLPKVPVYVISTSLLKKDIENLNLFFLDENKICDGLTKNSVKELIKKRISETTRAGWYFQQFLKMSVSRVISNDYYLIWDGDTVPLKNYDINLEHPFFDTKTEFNEAYFVTLKKLFPLINRKIDVSFISEHMIIDKKIMNEIINNIENNINLEGITFYEKIINAINIEDLNKSGFSEYETYGTYVCSKYPEYYRLRNWKSLRDENNWLPSNKLTKHLRKWLLNDFDAISFDNWQKYSRKKYYLFYILSYFLSYSKSEKLSKKYSKVISK